MIVVCSGYKFLDIDAYGGCIAYAELLNLLGTAAVAASTAPLNESITPTIRSWPVELQRSYVPTPSDTFILIDISDPEFFDTFVDVERVEEVIDHHVEFIDYWQQKLGAKGHLEFIGAACTMVYERWEQAGKLREMSETSARLLSAGILDNTLNFEADMTTDRDRTAFAVLVQLGNLPETWAAEYFGECQQAITADLPLAIKNDLKVLWFPSLGRTVSTGQLVVWDARAIVAEHLAEIQACMATAGAEWIMNVISISENRNYLVASDVTVQSFLSQLLAIQFGGNVATTNRLWLRKEIMKKDMENAQ